uniref:Reverse transcriptase domain-containing protein n=1 Tax=Tanacetum cinerariifolium TaxID=118510 RepID=A0A6L2MJ75_TANCI|nr:reverse transcriptase domain-containing protein [Tanacetum cinerariifolium]
MGELGNSKIMLLEFAIVKCRSPYSVILGKNKDVKPQSGNAKFMERNIVASTHGANVKDKEAFHMKNRIISGRRIGKEPMVSEGSWEGDAVKDDKGKIGFHTEEGVYCFTHMPKGLKNYAATLQNVIGKLLVKQKGRNVEVYLDEAVIKSKLEQDLIEDMEETLYKLQRVNMSLDPSGYIFEMKEGKFVGYMATTEGIKADLEKVRAILWGNAPERPDQIRSMSLQLTSKILFIPKLAELTFSFRNT